MNHFECKDALPLIGAYTDGELSGAQAGPLRQHLMSCPTCRNSAQASKAARRWFQQPLPGEGQPGQRGEDLVPPGFAARVARRAFAGETGEHAPESLGHLELTPAVVAGEVRAAESRAGVVRPTLSTPRGLLGFLVEMTGLAAAVLVALTVAFRMREVPSGEPLRADEALSVQEIKDRLSELNAAVEASAGLSPDQSPDQSPGAAPGSAAPGSDQEQ